MAMRRPLLAAGAVVVLAAAACTGVPAPSPTPSPSAEQPTVSAPPPSMTAPATRSPVSPPLITPSPSPGSDRVTPVELGLGEPFEPALGNPGYDVEHYDLALRWDPDSHVLEAKVTIEATAEEPLTAINLDFVGYDVEQVTVDGARAAFARTDADMTIALPTAVVAGDSLIVVVDYSGVPDPIESLSGAPIELGWRASASAAYVVAEPDGARAWFPCNDHPSDKATFTFRLTVPQGLLAAANGVLSETVEEGGSGTWVWTMDDPMATYLATVVIGEYEVVVDEPSSDLAGVTVRNVLPPGFDGSADPLEVEALSRQGEMIAYFADLFGAYPFDAYGVALVPDAGFVALETQSLTITEVLFDAVLAHEIVHQWFGNHVSPARWSDIWLNEGPATYGHWLWHERSGAGTVDEVARSEREFQLELALPPPGRPPADDLFNASVYGRAALTLHALRLTVGDEPFFAILRSWIERHGGSSASTDDFIALAEEIADAELDDLFDAWLFADAVPQLPD